MEVTEELAGCKLNGSAIFYEDSEEEIEWHVVGVPTGCLNKAENAAAMPDPPAAPPAVNFDVEDTADGDKASDNAHHIKVEFDANNIKFWFVQLEDEMLMAGINSQWLKRSVLQRNLP